MVCPRASDPLTWECVMPRTCRNTYHPPAVTASQKNRYIDLISAHWKVSYRNVWNDSFVKYLLTKFADRKVQNRNGKYFHKAQLQVFSIPTYFWGALCGGTEGEIDGRRMDGRTDRRFGISSGRERERERERAVCMIMSDSGASEREREPEPEHKPCGVPLKCTLRWQTDGTGEGKVELAQETLKVSI